MGLFGSYLITQKPYRQREAVIFWNVKHSRLISELKLCQMLVGYLSLKNERMRKLFLIVVHVSFGKRHSWFSSATKTCPVCSSQASSYQWPWAICCEIQQTREVSNTWAVWVCENTDTQHTHGSTSHFCWQTLKLSQKQSPESFFFLRAKKSQNTELKSSTLNYEIYTLQKMIFSQYFSQVFQYKYLNILKSRYIYWTYKMA